MSASKTAREWLSAHDRDWVTGNNDLLNATWAHFEATGQWQDPVEVLRNLRAANPSRRVAAALDEMPKALGQREYAPPRLVLSIFGLGCCPKAQTILSQYLAVSQLALRRFDLPGLPNRLTRADVVAELGLNEIEADRLSELLMRDAPFLGSGDANIDSWDRTIDPRVEDFEGIEHPDALLALLSSQRRIAEEPEVHLPDPPASADPPPPKTTSTDPQVLLTVLAALATVGTSVVNLSQSPSVLSLTVLGVFLGLTAGLALRRFWRHALLVGILLGALAGAAAGFFLFPDQSDGPYRYFVASTGKEDALVGLIEPRRGAAMQRDTVLGRGDPVSVHCLLSEEDEEWAKLENGSFVPAEALTVEVGGATAPRC
jgi:hypothetical protein